MTKLDIERLGHRGDGIADGPIYVPLALPGEVVEGEIVAGRMPAPRIVSPSPDRVQAPCRHFKSCGGCAMQHASDQYVAAWKQDVVRSALATQDLPAPIRGISTSPAKSRRRAVLSGRRNKTGVTVGFHARASSRVVDVPGCLLLLPDLMETIPVLGDIVRAGCSRRCELALTVTASNAGADVAVTGGNPLTGEARAVLATLPVARLSWNHDPVVQHSLPAQSFDGVAVVPPPGAFLQATLHGETALRNSVTMAIGPARKIVDLFSGCGTFALPLARQAEVHAVEGEAANMAALDLGWRGANGLKKVTCETRDLFRRPLEADEIAGCDAVVIDPPRAGAEAQCQVLADAGPDRIAMVSCNPISFARDARVLCEGGYTLDWIDVVDQFRWSSHVEVAARFSRR